MLRVSPIVEKIPYDTAPKILTKAEATRVVPSPIKVVLLSIKVVLFSIQSKIAMTKSPTIEKSYRKWKDTI